MKRIPTLAALLALGSCVAPPAPPPPPAPIAAPRAVPPPALARDWRDWPQTPGDWRYAATASGSEAQFAGGQLTLRCDRAGRVVVLSLAGAGGAATVRTTSTARTLTLAPTAAGRAAVALPATDPLLDAMGFSRGRFVVQPAGAPPLVVPAWAEVLRVAEDCRG